MSAAHRPGAWERFLAWLHTEEDARPLALVRIFCAATVLLHVGRYALSGAADVGLIHQDDGGLSLVRGWFEGSGAATVGDVRALCAVCCVAAALSMVGLFTRPSLVVTWIAMRAIEGLNPTAHGSYDSVLINTLFVLMLSGCGRAYSIDARYRKKGGPAAKWARFLLVVHFTLLYVGSGIGKGGSGWVPGGDASALWFILQQPTWSRIDGLPLWSYPITQVSTTVTWIFEVSAPLFLIAWLLDESSPRARWLAALKRGLAKIHYVEVYLLVGFLLHVGIEAMMEVGPFSFASVALYPAVLGPDRIARLVDRVRGLLERVRGGPAVQAISGER
ncbi:MAG: HTTM domain-containing protein [Sandaracinaceae bacterium]